MPVTQVVGPSAPQVGLDLVEGLAAIIGVAAGDVPRWYAGRLISNVRSAGPSSSE
jgi:hypothetical protein